MKNIIRNLLILTLLLFSVNSYAQQIPQAIKGKMVNDFAEVLSSKDEALLEQQLRTFNDSTSTQIAIVTVNSLDGMQPNQYATELAHKWGVGQKGKDNGIVILYKPKTRDSAGQVYIAVGYGLEGAVPDATAKLIVENEMIPLFREGKTAEGLSQAVNTLFGLVRGEYTADEYSKRSGGFPLFWIYIIIFLIILFIPSKKGSSDYSSREGTVTDNSIAPWILLSMMSSGRRTGGFGGGGFGGGSSFGGFGGGGFGGGGAGGSW